MAKDEKDPNDPATTSYAYDAMSPRWDRANVLLGGTDALRAAGAAFLPPHAEETHANYQDRLSSNYLFNVYELTLNMLTGKPFSMPVHLSDDTPDAIRELEDDIDLQGNSLTTVARELFKNGLSKSLCHLTVEFPRTEITDDEGNPVQRTVADDLRENPRPYWKIVYPEDVIFMHGETIDGQFQLTHVRIHEGEFIRSGFAEQWRERIRVLEPGFVTLYELVKDPKTRKERWDVVDQYDTGLDVVPMVTFYTNYENCGIGKPPLDDLAHLNIRHWQSNADQINILTVSRFPMLGASGVSEKMKNELAIGPRTLLTTREANGRYYYVEPQGRAIEAGRKDLESLEKQMVSYGAQFLREQPDRPVATGRVLDSSESMSALKAYAISLESTLQTALTLTAAWIGEAGGGTALLNKDFDLTDESESLNTLASLRNKDNPDISYDSFMEELKIRGVLSAQFNVEKNRQQLDEENDDDGNASGTT